MYDEYDICDTHVIHSNNDNIKQAKYQQIAQIKIIPLAAQGNRKVALFYLAENERISLCINHLKVSDIVGFLPRFVCGFPQMCYICDTF